MKKRSSRGRTGFPRCVMPSTLLDARNFKNKANELAHFSRVSSDGTVMTSFTRGFSDIKCSVIVERGSRERDDHSECQSPVGCGCLNGRHVVLMNDLRRARRRSRPCHLDISSTTTTTATTDREDHVGNATKDIEVDASPQMADAISSWSGEQLFSFKQSIAEIVSS